MNCKKAAEVASQCLDKEASFFERLLMHFHLFVCSLCRLYYRQIRVLRWIIRGYFNNLSLGCCEPCYRLSNEAKERISQAVRKAAE